jgi:hypothetical protein
MDLEKEYFDKSFKYVFDDIEKGNIECNLEEYWNIYLRKYKNNISIKTIDKFIKEWFFEYKENKEKLNEFINNQIKLDSEFKEIIDNNFDILLTK